MKHIGIMLFLILSVSPRAFATSSVVFEPLSGQDAFLAISNLIVDQRVAIKNCKIAARREKKDFFELQQVDFAQHLVRDEPTYLQIADQVSHTRTKTFCDNNRGSHISWSLFSKACEDTDVEEYTFNYAYGRVTFKVDRGVLISISSPSGIFAPDSQGITNCLAADRH